MEMKLSLHRAQTQNSLVRGDNTRRVTNQGVRQLINSLKETINQQTAVIKSTKADLLDVKNDQQVLKIKNEELQEEGRALRLQTDSLPKATPPRSWAAIAASASDPGPQTNDQQSKKEQNQVQVSTSHSQDSDQENNGDNSSNSFKRYLPTNAANTHLDSLA